MIKPVIIDSDGVYKYIQIQLLPRPSLNPNGVPVTIVRGYLDCPYHADILAKFNYEELG